MNTNMLNKAISQLPQFVAPDVWKNIKKQLPPTYKRGKFVLLSLASISIVAIIAGYYLTDNIKTKAIRYQQRNENIAMLRYYNNTETVLSNQVIVEFNKQNHVSPPLQTDTIIPHETLTMEEPDINTENLIPPAFRITAEIKTTYINTGENLVINGNFEEYTICPSGFTDRPVKKLLPHWEVPSKGTPDYFNVCSKMEAGVPENFAGRVYAYSGYGYAGLILRKSFTNENKITGVKPLDYREYIQTELKQELVKGKKYRIQFWVCNASKSRYAVDAFGAVLTADRIKTNDNCVLDYNPAVKNGRNNILTNQTFWVSIEGIYEAKGGEKYLTLGNFNYNYATLYTMMDPNSKFNYAYYYIDDVSVVEVNEIFETINIPAKNSTDSIITNDGIAGK